MEIDEKQYHAYELSYNHQTIFRTLNKDNIDLLKKWFSDFSERQEFINNINILNEKIDQLEMYKIEFVNALDDLIWFVKLGNNLKGECLFCPPGTLATIKSFFID